MLSDVPHPTPPHSEGHREAASPGSLSSLNRMCSEHLNIFVHCASLASNALFLMGIVTCLFIHQCSFQMVLFHWRHPVVEYSFLCSYSFSFCCHSRRTHTLSSTSSISNTWHGDLYMTGIRYKRKERQGKLEKEREGRRTGEKCINSIYLDPFSYCDG